jgi:putative ABC transport system permease protein
LDGSARTVTVNRGTHVSLRTITMLSESFVQDLRIGLRVLVKERAFCALAIAVLAIGISAVTTQFCLINGVMLRGFSFPNASRLMNVNFIDPKSANFFGVNGRILSMDFQELAAEQKSFDLLAAYLNGSTVNVTVNGSPQRYTGAYVTEHFLRILGVAPILGRDLTASDNVPGAPKVALISYSLWQRDFGAASDIVGKGVRINGSPATIIGVMPQGFTFPSNEELWIPLYTEFPVLPRNDPRANAPAVLGLIRNGVSPEQAQAEVTAFARRFAKAYPDTNSAFNAGLVEPLLEAYTPASLRGMLWTMLAFCVGVLLIACVNVMNMQFARATLRAKELAVRSALGATRIRLVRQMLTESLLVASVGAAAGVVLAYFSADWLDATLHNLENPPPAWMIFTLDGRALAFTVLATLVAALVSGLLPAWMASRRNAATVLRDGTRGTTGRGIGLVTRGLVVFQVVVTCVLLIGSLLQVRSIVAQQTIDYGYDTAGVLSARMGLMDADYPTPASRKAFLDRLLLDLDSSAEFEGAAYSSRLQMVQSNNGPIEIEGKVYKDRRDRPNTNFEQVSPGEFALIGQKFVQGRNFTPEEVENNLPVAIVNEAFARKHFGADSAIGRRFRTGDGTREYGPWRSIVGVVTTVRMIGPYNIPNVDESGFYVPTYTLGYGPAPELVPPQFVTVLVKPHKGQDAEALAPALRRHVNAIDPNLPLYFVAVPKRHLDNALAASRIIAAMFTAFGLVAVLLAAVGIYGVVSFSVNQRTQEFGVRMALGAGFGRIMMMVVKQGARQLALGLFLGFGLAYALATVGADAIGNILYRVSSRDPFTYVSVFLVVTLVSLVAVLVPARRATRVDPMIALRAE